MLFVFWNPNRHGFILLFLGQVLSLAGTRLTKMLRVLYLHPFAAYGGATKSLSEMLAAMPQRAVCGVAVTPAGIAAKSFEAAGVATIRVAGISQWDDTRFGHYRGARWLILLRELAYWPSTIRGLLKARRQGPYDLIHCNEITILLPALFAKWYLKVPLVVHVRSLQRGVDGGRVSAWLMGKLGNTADAVVAIDEAVRRTLPPELPVTVIHNGLRLPAESRPKETNGPLCVGIIGVLHRAKGVYEFVEAARILRDRGIAVHFLVVGENVRSTSGPKGWLLSKLDFSRDVRGELEAYVRQHALQDVVEFTGFVPDIRPIYGRLDVVCFPSHLDAPGRPVFEAALFGLPTVVAMRDPTSDVIVNEKTGLCIDDPTPEAIADAVQGLCGDRARASEMGAEARRLALSRFESSKTAQRMLDLYRKVCAR